MSKVSIELPCEIGQPLWCVNDNNEVERVECLGFVISEAYEPYVCYHEKYRFDNCYMPIGKLIYLTEREANDSLISSHLKRMLLFLLDMLYAEQIKQE